MVTDVRPATVVAEEPRHVDDAVLRTRIDEILNRRPAVGLAIGVVRRDGLALFHGHGLADVATRSPITEHTVFRIASITKTFTALAIMQLWERGLIDLDAPANEYLRAYRLVPTRATFRPATVRDLLTHSAGLPETIHPRDMLRPDWGESVPAGAPLPSLAQLYGGRLRVEAEPGSRFVYGNHSPATLGQIVEDVSGEPLGRYFREHIFAPLGMEESGVGLADPVAARLATGYTFAGGRPREIELREWVTVGAASVCSTPSDMARYVAALLGGGANDHGRVVQPATLALMFGPQYRPDPRLAGMGLGFFRDDVAGRPVVDHKGLMPGFDSQMTVAPGDGIGVIAFTNGGKDGVVWLPAEVLGLLRRALGLPDDAVRTDVPQRPEVWGEVCGWYRLPAGLSDVRLRTTLGLGAEVFVRGGGLMLRFLAPIPPLLAGFPLVPDDPRDPYAFRVDMTGVDMGTSRVVLRHGESAGTTALCFDMMPLVLDKQPGATNPRLLVGGGLAALGAAVGAAALRRSRRATNGQPGASDSR